MKSDRKPKWDKWRHMPNLEVWQAIALSLDIEPAQVRRNSNGGIFEDAVFDEGEVFNDRLEVLIGNLGRAVPPTSMAIFNPHMCSISMQQFASWALSIGWDVPEELAEMATHQESPVSDLAKLNVPEGLDNTTAQRLQVMIEAAETYWKGVTSESEKIPTNDAVAAWIENTLPNVSQTMANNMARIIRPDWAKDRTWGDNKKR